MKLAVAFLLPAITSLVFGLCWALKTKPCFVTLTTFFSLTAGQGFQNTIKMAGSPIFSVNFTNRKNSAVLNYDKSWSWSNQPVLGDFYIMFLLVSSLWMFVTIFYAKHGVTADVWCHNILTFHPASVENRREKSLRVSSLLELKYTSTLSCRRYDETKKLFCTR